VIDIKSTGFPNRLSRNSSPGAGGGPAIQGP
jgi:hypothetical protein